jgi:hypothetical protein
MARPTRLTPEVQEAVCEAIRNGATYQAASEAAGIAYATFNEWRKDARLKYVKFSEAVTRANADAQLDLLAKIGNQADKDWRAAAWILERRFKNDFGAAVDVTTGGDKIKGYAIFSPDDWDKDATDSTVQAASVADSTPEG